MNCSTPGFPVHHQLPEFTQTHVHQVSDAIQPSHPLSSPSPPAPNPSQNQSFPMSQLFTWGGQSIVWAPQWLQSLTSICSFLVNTFSLFQHLGCNEISGSFCALDKSAWYWISLMMSTQTNSPNTYLSTSKLNYVLRIPPIIAPVFPEPKFMPMEALFLHPKCSLPASLKSCPITSIKVSSCPVQVTAHHMCY